MPKETEGSFMLTPELLPLMEAAIKAAGQVVAAQVDKGYASSWKTSEEYGAWIASIAASTITHLTPVKRV
jgi:hypothetical protein